MKILFITAILSLVFGSTLGLLGQELDTDSATQQDQPKAQEPQRPAQPSAQQPQAKPQSESPQKAQTPEVQHPRREKTGQQPPAQTPQQSGSMRIGGRIPQKQFRANFGPQHPFQVRGLNGNRFQAGGFLFEVVEVWPTFWSFDDFFFIDQINEQFFLFDTNHPGTRLLLIVVE
jgi:hypothetical protein